MARKGCTTCGAVDRGPAQPPPGPAVVIVTGSAIRFPTNAQARRYHETHAESTLILGPEPD